MDGVEICHDPQVWDKYVASHPSSYNQHRWRWQDAVRGTFGHEPYYLGFSVKGTLQGILPLFFIRSRIFGNSLVSMPFFSYGGILANSPEAEAALLGKAVELAEKLGAGHIELRQGTSIGGHWREVPSKIDMEVLIPDSVEDLWNRLSPRVRKRVRHARKAGFTERWGGIEDVDSFYSVFATNMRNLGTPVYPKAWFERLCRQSPEDVRILTIWRGEKPAAAAFLLAYRETLELPWAVSLEEYRANFSPLLLYWAMLEWAVRQGFRRVDLGRCAAGSGNHAFKRHWTQEERPLHWCYWLAPGSGLPQARPDNPRYHFAIEMWKRLPLSVANQLGPIIVRGLP